MSKEEELKYYHHEMSLSKSFFSQLDLHLLSLREYRTSGRDSKHTQKNKFRFYNLGHRTQLTSIAAVKLTGYANDGRRKALSYQSDRMEV